MNEKRPRMGRPAGSGEQGNYENINLKVPKATKRKLTSMANRKNVSLGALLRPFLEDIVKK